MEDRVRAAQQAREGDRRRQGRDSLAKLPDGRFAMCPHNFRVRRADVRGFAERQQLRAGKVAAVETAIEILSSSAVP